MTSEKEEITTAAIIDSIQHLIVRYAVRAQAKGVSDLPEEVVSLLTICIDQFERMEEYIGDMVDTLEVLAQQVESSEKRLAEHTPAEWEF